MAGVGAMGPGTPTPVTYSPRRIGTGSPLSYYAKANQVQADVARASGGENLSASFEPRPPVRPPGASPIGGRGSNVDASA